MHLQKWQDSQVIARLKRGDPGLRQELYDDYAPLLYSSICRLVPRPEACGPLLIEAFKCIFERLPDFDPGHQGLFSWMYAVMQRGIMHWHETRNTD